jgi:hypothetical protein
MMNEVSNFLGSVAIPSLLGILIAEVVWRIMVKLRKENRDAKRLP